MHLCVYEDASVARLAPLAWTRPASFLRCGARTLLERQEWHLGGKVRAALVRPEMEAVCRLMGLDLAVNHPLVAEGGPLTLVNARWLPPGGKADLPTTPALGLVGEEVVYAVFPEGAMIEASLPGVVWCLGAVRRDWPARQAGGHLIDYPWHLVEHNAGALLIDEEWWAEAPSVRPEGVAVIGPAERLSVDPEATVEPQVVVDTRSGPVRIDRGALVGAFTRLEGPCYVGPETQVHGGRVRGSSFGPQCRIGGEVEASIVHGFSNKAHDGFLGHSYLGEWVNIGAGSITSDLRNDYGSVPVFVGGKKVETGLLKVGSFVGDHTKASIGCLFNTGSLIGPFGLLVATGTLLPKFVPAFCQLSGGKLTERTDLGRMFATAATAMARRGCTWTEAHAELYLDLYEKTSGERRALLQAREQQRMRQLA